MQVSRVVTLAAPYPLTEKACRAAVTELPRGRGTCGVVTAGARV